MHVQLRQAAYEDKLASAIASEVATRLQGRLLRIESRLDMLLGCSRADGATEPEGMGFVDHLAEVELDTEPRDTQAGLARFHQELPRFYRRTQSSSGESGDCSSSGWSSDASDVRPQRGQWRYWILRCLESEEPKRTGWAYEVVSADWFSKLSFLVVILNTLFIWYITNYISEHHSHRLPQAMHVIEFAFIFYYMIEIFLRLCVHRCYFFWNEEWGWNIFDIIIVVLGVWELLLQMDQKHLSINVTFLRISRVLRVAKILRIFKTFRFLQELQVMMSCVLGSMLSLLWACTFLLILLMISSLVLVQSMTNYRIDHPECQDTKECQDIRLWFGSVHSAMVSLFQCTTGGMDWGDVYSRVELAGGTTPLFFISYIIFFNFAFFNIITSIFVDKAMKLAKPDDECLAKERTIEERELTQRLGELFEDVDDDGNGVISVEEIKSASQKAKVFHRFELLGITLRDVETFFSTLTAMTDDGKLSKDTFVEGCLRMKGPASSLVAQAILLQVQELCKKIQSKVVLRAKSSNSTIEGCS